jgi:hypothetical protein
MTFYAIVLPVWDKTLQFQKGMLLIVSSAGQSPLYLNYAKGVGRDSCRLETMFMIATVTTENPTFLRSARFAAPARHMPLRYDCSILI